TRYSSRPALPTPTQSSPSSTPSPARNPPGKPPASRRSECTRRPGNHAAAQGEEVMNFTSGHTPASCSERVFACAVRCLAYRAQAEILLALGRRRPTGCPNRAEPPLRPHEHDYLGAAQDLEQALGIYRDLGNRLGQANALYSLGITRRRTGDYPGA